MIRKFGIRRPRGQHKCHQASTYIKTFDEIQAGTKVMLWCRVSSGPQNANGNNNDQRAGMEAAVKNKGGIVVGVISYAGRACDAEAQLYKAANDAHQAGAMLLAESTSRFARPQRYHPKDRPHLVARAHELRNLRWVCGNIRLVTLHDPDISWKDERALQSKRGQRQKGNKGGRPAKPKPGYTKRRRERLLPEVRRLMQEGMSYRAIGRTLGIDEKNVRRWVRRFF